jgi:hypothetical protein
MKGMQNLGYGLMKVFPMTALPQHDVAGIAAEERTLSGQYVGRQEMSGLIYVRLIKRSIAQSAARAESAGYPTLLRQLSYLIKHYRRGYLHYHRAVLEGTLLSQNTPVPGQQNPFLLSGFPDKVGIGACRWV